ncbi:MAG: tRNA pseudouridine(38-40) synthase TruA [Acidimicrobiales bacterium]
MRPDPQGGEAPTLRWRIDLAYEGAGFSGFAAQPGQETVAGALAQALQRTARMSEIPKIVCAGRTDAGVHARGQVVHVDLPQDLPTIARGGSHRSMSGADLRAALNRQLAPKVVVKSAQRAWAGFDARRSALARAYRYLVYAAAVPDPLLAPVSWHVAVPLELRAMAAAADALVGAHDFAAFCRRPPSKPAGEPLVRRVRRATWTQAVPGDGTQEGWLLRFEIEADSFCHQMVRSVVALLVEVGKGRTNPARVVEALGSKTRAGLPQPAPPHGLCLVSVSYPEGAPPANRAVTRPFAVPVGWRADWPR